MLSDEVSPCNEELLICVPPTEKEWNGEYYGCHLHREICKACEKAYVNKGENCEECDKLM